MIRSGMRPTKALDRMSNLNPISAYNCPPIYCANTPDARFVMPVTSANVVASIPVGHTSTINRILAINARMLNIPLMKKMMNALVWPNYR